MSTQGDEIRFVQFLHPGPESKPDEHGWKRWRGPPEPHRRTFIKNPGQLLHRLDGNLEFDELHFWCEWEPDAQLIKQFPTPVASGYPEFLFRPCLSARPKEELARLHNTDPFVFDGAFRYCSCLQGSFPELKYLAPGSVILFGSRMKLQFVVDTVFVLSAATWFGRDKCEMLPVPEHYRQVSLYPGCNDCSDGERLYEGATFERPFEGMFSFFPCLPAGESASHGFSRPTVAPHGRLMGYIDSEDLMHNGRKGRGGLPANQSSSERRRSCGGP